MHHSATCLRIVLFAFICLSLSSLSGCGLDKPGTESNPSDASTTDKIAPDSIPGTHNELVVQRQSTTGNEIVIEKLNALKKSWLYIAKKTPQSPSDIFATIAIAPGQRKQWKVQLENPIETNAQVVFSLHVDDGDGTFDPQKDEVARGKVKRLSFTVLITKDTGANNLLVIEDQNLFAPDNKKIVVKLLVLPKESGRVMIFKDKAGKPGDKLGQVVKSTGEHKDLSIRLSEAIAEAQTLHAILYSGKGTWSIATPVLKDKDGKEIKTTFQITTRSPNQGGVLLMEDQTTTGDYRELIVKEVSLPKGYPVSGVVAFYADKDGKPGDKIGSGEVTPNKRHVDIAYKLDRGIIGNEIVHVALVDGTGLAFTDEEDTPITTIIQVQGDLTNPNLVIDSQSLPATDLKTLKLQFISIPSRFRIGWVALYADDNGKPGKLVDKKLYKAGTHEDSSFEIIRAFDRKQILHAALHEGRPGSASWSSTNPVMKSFSGEEIRTTFQISSDSFAPVLEIADQSLPDNITLTIGKVTVPQAYFYAQLAIYADDNGKRGTLLGKRTYLKGTTTGKTIKLPKQQGELTLHGVLHEGQRWTGSNPVMKDENGNDMEVSFKIGAKDLNYLDAPAITTPTPTKVVVKRAHSITEQAWIVIARDDNGKPGQILGKKRVPPRFAGRVYINLDETGTTYEYLRGTGIRRAIQGEENVHVLMYADNPKDNKFTYTPGGTEDQPILTASGQQVATRMKVSVKSSIDNSQSKSEYFYKPCTVSQYTSKPTKLKIDCRCNRVGGGAFPNCCPIAIPRREGFKYGKGPQVSTLNIGRFISGFTEKKNNELISVVSWLDTNKRPENQIAVHVGVIMAINATTGDRRIISGLYNDSAKGIYDTGKGPVLSYPFDVQKGPTGKYYVASYGYTRGSVGLNPTVDIIQVDPKTGDRTYVWRSNHLGNEWAANKSPYGHCANGRNPTNAGNSSVQFSRRTFAIDDKGNFYLSYANNGKNQYSEGIGIARISADGKKCDVITSSHVGKANLIYKGKNVGAGPSPQAGPYHGMIFKDGLLYAAINIGSEVYQIDVATGNRKLLYKQGQQGQAYSSPGNRMKWDAQRKLIWLNGLSPQVLLLDPKTGDNAGMTCNQQNRDFRGIQCAIIGTPWQVNAPGENGFWFHPTNPDIAFFSRLFTIVKYELSTGNNYIWSL